MPYHRSWVRLSRRLAALGPLASALAGCSLFGNYYGDVKSPGTDIVAELGTVSRFAGEGGNFADLVNRASLGDLKGTCDVDDDGVKVDMTLSILAQLGPKSALRTASFPYFVAITDPRGRVIAKQTLNDTLTFAGSENRSGATDSLSEMIPLANPREAASYHVFVGFQLTPEELAFNRNPTPPKP